MAKIPVQQWKAKRHPNSRPVWSDNLRQIAALNLWKENRQSDRKHRRMTPHLKYSAKPGRRRNLGWLMTFWIYVTGEEASRKGENSTVTCKKVQLSQSRNQKRKETSKRKLDHRLLSRNWFRNRWQKTKLMENTKGKLLQSHPQTLNCRELVV